MALEPRLPLGKGRVVDHHVGAAVAAKGARPVERVAAAVVAATDAAQQHAQVVAVVAARGRRLGDGFALATQQHLHAIGVDRIPGAQQCHAPHRAAIDVDAAAAAGHLQPDPALVGAEAGQQQRADAVVAQADLPAGIADDALHPRR